MTLTPRPPGRLRSLDDERLIDRPLKARRSVIWTTWRKRPGKLVWSLAVIITAIIFVTLG